MSFSGKSLAANTVQTALAALFTASAALCTYVKSLSLSNTNAITQTIDVYLTIGGTDFFFRRFVLALDESADVLSDGATWELSPGDAIKAVTTTAGAVPFTITGVEEN
jgi:hypothetical protein